MRKESLRLPVSWFFSSLLPCFLIRTSLSACVFVCTGVPVPPSRLLRLDVFTTYIYIYIYSMYMHVQCTYVFVLHVLVTL